MAGAGTRAKMGSRQGVARIAVEDEAEQGLLVLGIQESLFGHHGARKGSLRLEEGVPGGGAAKQLADDSMASMSAPLTGALMAP